MRTLIEIILYLLIGTGLWRIFLGEKVEENGKKQQRKTGNQL